MYKYPFYFIIYLLSWNRLTVYAMELLFAPTIKMKQKNTDTLLLNVFFSTIWKLMFPTPKTMNIKLFVS